MLLSVDAGGSATKWALLGPDGTFHAEGRLEPLTGHLYTVQDEQNAARLLQSLVGQLPERPQAVVAGITGLGDSAWFRASLAALLDLAPELVHVGSDMQLAYAAHFAPGEGVLVYAGTGSVSWVQLQGGEVLRAGGHGFLLGDEGGAFWQGREAVRRVLLAQDRGEGPSPLLAAQLAGMTLGSDWPHLRRWVYEGGKTALASLAPAVERAALAGDAVALGILKDAGEYLATLAQTLLRRCPPHLPVVLCGGAANPLVRADFEAALPGVRQLPPRSPLLGALRLSPLLALQLVPAP
jgi:glucosamine kinase